MAQRPMPKTSPRSRPPGAIAPRTPAPTARSAQQQPVQPVPPIPPPSGRGRLPARRSRSASGRWMNWAIFAAPAALLGVLFLISVIGAALLLGGNRALHGVRVAGIPVGGMTVDEIVTQLQQVWGGRGVLLRDGIQIYPVQPDLLGIHLDAAASAEIAVRYGRSAESMGSLLRAAFGEVTVAPVISLDREAFMRGIREIAPQIEHPPQNAGVTFIDGILRERPAQEGRAVDVAATLEQLEAQGVDALRDGALDLAMLAVTPSVTDATPVLAAAESLIASPFTIDAYNPVTNSRHAWTVQPGTWVSWLTAQADETQPTGLALSFDQTALRGYLEAQGSTLGTHEYLDLDAALSTINDAIFRSETSTTLRVFNRDIPHNVATGETITSIAWDYGVPYLYIEQANPGLSDGLSVGETITIPSADNFLELAVVPNKRIVVSISEQRVRVYEDGAVKWDWVASTGIASSPTWTGIYQIISHEPNAYAGNWDLWMPNFMGVYRPIPGADFTNGFHGFPTRGGSQLLWTNSLGTRVTYGCILLSNDNIRLLYDWAEQGVIVEIQA